MSMAKYTNIQQGEVLPRAILHLTLLAKVRVRKEQKLKEKSKTGLGRKKLSG